MTQVERYLEFLEYGRQFSKNTLKAVEHDLKMFDGDVEKALRYEVESFVIKQNKKGLSTATINRRISTLKNFFDWQLINGIRQGINPALKIAPKIKHKRTQTLTESELNDLYNNAPNDNLRVAIALMGFAGLRVGEVAKLGSDNKVYEDEDGNLAIHLVKTKGDKERHVTLSLTPDPKLIKEVHDNGGIIGQRGAYSDNGLWRICKSYFKTQGYNHLTPHSLRHTFSTLLVENDVNIGVVRDVLGHSGIGKENNNYTTSRYVSTSSVEQQAKELQEVFG